MSTASPSALLIALAVMLAAALWRDLAHRRIDNWITFTGAACAIGLHLTLAGAEGAGFALGGLAVGLIVLLPFYISGGMAAGDVKLMAAAGAFLGPVDCLWAAGFSLMTGAVLAVGVLAIGGGLREGLTHVSRQIFAYSMTQVWAPAAAGTAASHRFPYALAITCGCLMVTLWRFAGGSLLGD